MDWHAHARRLADQATDTASRWHEPIATTPRHVFVPRWWEHAAPGWTLNDGATGQETWLRDIYRDATLVTSVAGRHADHASPDDRVSGFPTSSSPSPGLVVRMLRHARLYDGADILDVGTGSGYEAALLAHRFGNHRVTSVDVDPYLTRAAADRLHRIGLDPTVAACDATGPLPAAYDRIVATVAVRPIPASWLAALRPGGRLVTVIANTSVIVTAEKTPDGGAEGRVEWDRASFMRTRPGPTDYPPMQDELIDQAEHDQGERVSCGLYPVVDVDESWELASILELEAPGIETIHDGQPGGPQQLMMVHPDGSWARATMQHWEPPVVHQAGPRRLWDILDDLRTDWLRRGRFELHGAWAVIDPDGTIHLARGDWRATIR